MVGLEPIARFTHGIEAVLEKIRSGSLAVDSDIITTLLESRDHLAAMVEGDAAGSPIPGSGELSQRLAELLRVTPRGQAAPSSSSPPASEAGKPHVPQPGSVTGRPTPALPSQTDLPSGPPERVAPAVSPSDTPGAGGNVAAAPSSPEPPAQVPGPIKPRRRVSKAKNKDAAEPKPSPRQRKSRGMDRAEPSAPGGAEPPSAGAEGSLEPDSSVLFLQDHTDSRTGYPPPGRQPSRRAGRTARARRVDRDHRSAGRSLAGRAGPGTLLPELDHHGPDQRRRRAPQGRIPLCLRG